MDVEGFKRDSKAIESGQWVGDIPGMGDMRLRVRGLSSPTYLATRARKERRIPSSERERDGTLKPAAAMRVYGEALAETVLLEWDGLTQGGKPLPYDKALALEWLTNPDYVKFADAVTYAANVVDRGGDPTGEAPKNSRGSSATK